MRYKNIFILLIMLSLIISIIPTLSAANNENKNATNNNPIMTSIDDTIDNINNFFSQFNQESIDVHGYEELENVITNRSKEKVKKTYVINLKDGDYNITKRIVCGRKNYASFKINGNGHTIDGKGKKQFMEVYGNLEINNLKIKHQTSKE
jgi:hypothetical protein